MPGFSSLPIDYSKIRPRHRMRLNGYDYKRSGKYFVTLVTKNRKPLFGKISNQYMNLNTVGEIVKRSWEWMGNQYPYVGIDKFVIMPDHLHGLVVIHRESVVPRNNATSGSKRKSLGRLTGAFKTVSTKQKNQDYQTPGKQIWHHNFHDNIIRGGEDLRRIRQYIDENPAVWSAHEN